MMILFLILEMQFSSLAVNRVPQHVQSDAGGVVSVKTFGALGDGVTDDTRAFQESLAQLNHAGGGTLMIPRGLYVITKTLEIGNHVSMIGDGVGLSVLFHKQGKGQSTILCGSTNASADFLALRDFSIRCTAAPDPPMNSVQAGGIVVMNSHSVTIERVTVDSSYIYGIWFWNVTDGRILNCGIKGVNYDGIAVQFAKRISIEGNQSSSNGYDGIIISNNGLNASTVTDHKVDSTFEILCSNNFVENEKVGFEIVKAEVSIFNNIISETHAFAVGLMGGCSNSLLTSNTIRCADGYGIIVTGAGDGPGIPTTNCTITNNFIRGSVNEAIGLHFGGQHFISGNKILESQENGILVYQSNGNTIIANRVVASKFDGIKLGHSSNCVVTNNVIDNASNHNPQRYYAIDLDSFCQRITVNDNIVLDPSSILKAGINFAPSAGHQIQGNVVPAVR